MHAIILAVAGAIVFMVKPQWSFMSKFGATIGLAMLIGLVVYPLTR
jgi:hypothetical protein